MKHPSTPRWGDLDGASRRALTFTGAFAAGALVIVIAVLLDVGPFAGLDTRPGVSEGSTAATRYEVRNSPPPPALGPAEQRRQTSSDPRRLWRDPGFRLAAVRKGQRVGIFDRPEGSLVDRVGDQTEIGSSRVFSVTGRRQDWLRVTTPVATDNRNLWIRADPTRLSFETTDISVHVNLAKRVVEVERGDRVVRSFPVTIGAPGSTTPTGRFAVTDLIVGGLSPVYGCCAIATSAHQADLQPGWIGGDRVAIHGTTGPVGAAASNGCVRASNADAEFLVRTLPLGTPVFINS